MSEEIVNLTESEKSLNFIETVIEEDIVLYTLVSLPNPTDTYT